MNDNRHTHNFRFLLALAILTPLMVSMAAVGLATSYLGHLSVAELTETIVQQTVGRVSGQMWRLLEIAQDQNKLNLRVMAGRPPCASDFQRLAAAMVPSFEVHEELDSTYYAIENTGEFFNLVHETNHVVSLLTRTMDPEGKWHHRSYLWTGSGWKFDQELTWDDYDPRRRPFYTAAKEALDEARESDKKRLQPLEGPFQAWTPTYLFWKDRPGDRPITGVTCTTPVADSEKHLLGVWGVDLNTLSLCDYLAVINPEVPGYAFVVEEHTDGTRRMVAHPERRMVVNQNGMLFNNVREIADEPVKAMLRQIPARFSTLANKPVHSKDPLSLSQVGPDSVSARTKTFSFRDHGTNYLGGYFIIEPRERTLVGMVLPENEVMGRVNENVLWFFATFATVLAGSVPGIYWLARRASRPLVELQREAHAVGRLELTPSDPPLSRIREIRELGHAMALMKTNLRSFRKYVPADLVGDLVRSGREAVLGGERIHATVYFSDIANFTPVAEKLRPEETVEHLGAYLQAMSDGVAQYGGTVDKFIGDSVMAFWNAPRPNPVHAADACRAALANQHLLDSLNEQWKAADKPVFRTRIGLHTGPVIVGNIGSEYRMNYTVIGDTVNLASRVENLNKLYGTRILISETTRAAAGATISTRPVDRTSVKGKTTVVTVYELLCEAEAETPELAELKHLTGVAFGYYQHGDYARAVEAYRDLLKRWPADGVAAFLLRRCEELAAKPPTPHPPVG